jgi:hypothetical protein
MKVNAVAANRIQAYTYSQNPAAEENQQPPAAAVSRGIQDDIAAVLERSERAKEEFNAKKSGPSDRSGSLTRRLVAARYQGEVYAIISEAHKNLSEWLEAALDGDASAMAAIRRLNRLIRRASRKVSDLNREDVLQQKQRRAEKREQEQAAAQIKAELKRKMAERVNRERGYMRDIHYQANSPPGFPKPMSPAELEAKVLALAGAVQTVSSTGHNTDCIQPGGDIGSPSPPPPACSPATE